jgi:sec-independent protein translocase protein TatA
MGELLTPTHLTVIAVIACLFFGGKKLPELGKGMGEGLRGLRTESRG